jgi:predicted ATP-grasp superfamily ATP-dependent carboligase
MGSVLDPRDLYTRDGTGPPAPEAGRPGPVLIHALTGFVDAGHAGRLARDHLLETFEHRTLATFDVDTLLDYRSRRPVMVFEADHWVSYDDPSLVLHEIVDGAGQRFLLLEGAEPDVQWERFIAAVRGLVEELGVRLTIGLHGIPMGVPHTRPTNVTAHATRSELIAGREPWIGTVQVPGSVVNLLEYRLGQSGRDAIGFAVHVPHYLAQAEYPAAAAALLDNVAAATDLVLPTTALHSAAERTRTELDEQVAESQEVAGVVTALEQQYDAFLATRSESGSGGELLAGLSGPGGFPTADELGAEFERFLADQAKGTDPPDA